MEGSFFCFREDRSSATMNETTQSSHHMLANHIRQQTQAYQSDRSGPTLFRSFVPANESAGSGGISFRRTREAKL
jgi:hypothetical protein